MQILEEMESRVLLHCSVFDAYGVKYWAESVCKESGMFIIMSCMCCSLWFRVSRFAEGRHLECVRKELIFAPFFQRERDQI